MYQRLRAYIARKGLKWNETKSRVLDANRESFRFLGFEIGMRTSRFTGGRFTHVQPSRKAQQKVRDAVRKETASWTHWRSCTETLQGVNRIVRGWSNYFHYGNNTKVFGSIRLWVERRIRTWLWQKYDRKLGRYSFFTNERLYGQYQLWKMPSTAGWTR